MAFDADALSLAVNVLGSGDNALRIHFYRTDDSIATVTGAFYFTRAVSRGVHVGDVIVFNADGVTSSGTVIDENDDGDVTVDVSQFVGDPVAPTQSEGDNSTFIATTEFVQTARKVTELQPEDAACVAGGVDNWDEFAALFALAPGKRIVIPNRTYRSSFAVDHTWDLPDNCIIEGAGPDSLLEIYGVPAAATRFLCNVAGSNLTIRNLKIKLVSPGAGSTTVFFQPGGAENFVLENVEIDGSVTDAGVDVSHHAQIIRPVGTVGLDFTGITARDCYVHDCTRFYYRLGNATDVAVTSRITVEDNRFENNFRDIIALNSPFATTSDVSITGNRVVNIHGRTTGGTSQFAFGVGNGKDVVVSGNFMSGTGDFIHIEESAEHVFVSGNECRLTDAACFACRFTDNNIGTGSYIIPSDLVISGNIFQGPGQATSTGRAIWHLNDASGSPAAKRMTIVNNVCSGWNYGISLTRYPGGASDVLIMRINGNILHDCNRGVWSPNPVGEVTDCSFDTCDYGLYADNYGVWGTGHTFTNCGAEVYNSVGAAENERFSAIPLFAVHRTTLYDDFVGDVIADQWNGILGTNGLCVTPTLAAGTGNGVVRLTAGSGAGADMATNGCQLEQYLQWNTTFGGVLFQARTRFSISASITSCCVFMGLTDQVGVLEMPFTMGAGDALTSNATDAVGLLFDTAADTDNWWMVGVKADVDATKQNSGFAPVLNVYETWRFEMDELGVATFKRNGAVVGTAMSAAVTVSANLTPVVAIFSRQTAQKFFDVDYLLLQKNRF